MNYAEAVELLTNCFQKHQSKTVTRIICIDYMPLTVWRDNTEYYCAIESTDGNDYSIVFKNHFSSDRTISGCFRDINLSLTDLISNLTNALEKLLSLPSDIEVQSLLAAFPNETLHKVALGTSKEKKLQKYTEDLKVAIDVIADLAGSEYSENVKLKYISLLEDVVKALRAIREVPDTLDNLLDFINVDRITSIQNINEVFAKNILTKDDYSDNDYMLMANFELMHLFFGRFSSTKRFYTAVQRIYQAMPEFVPILMKFSGVPNPILDVVNGSCVYENLKPSFRFLQNTELVTNRCSFTGSCIDNSEDDFDYEVPTSFEYSRIVYGLASDIDEIYCESGISITPQIDPLITTEYVVYTSDLAVGIIQAALVAGMISGDVPNGFISQQGIRGYMTLGLTLSEEQQTVSYITIYDAFKKLFGATHTSEDYVEILLLRGILYSRSSKSKLTDITSTQRSLQHALAECQHDILAFRDMGVNLDED